MGRKHHPLKNYYSKTNLFRYTLGTCKCWLQKRLKMHRNMSPPIFSELFYRRDSSYNLQSNSNFAVSNVKPFHGSESISYLGPKVWDIVLGNLGYCTWKSRILYLEIWDIVPESLGYCTWKSGILYLKVWDTVPVELKELTSLNAFRKGIKKWQPKNVLAGNVSNTYQI